MFYASCWDLTAETQILADIVATAERLNARLSVERPLRAAVQRQLQRAVAADADAGAAVQPVRSVAARRVNGGGGGAGAGAGTGDASAHLKRKLGAT